MLSKLRLSAALGVFALSGCEDHLPYPEPFGTTVVVYLDGEADHCIDAEPGQPAHPVVPLPQLPLGGPADRPALFTDASYRN
jgi:hypothetical protein